MSGNASSFSSNQKQESLLRRLRNAAVERALAIAASVRQFFVAIGRGLSSIASSVISAPRAIGRGATTFVASISVRLPSLSSLNPLNVFRGFFNPVAKAAPAPAPTPATPKEEVAPEAPAPIPATLNEEVTLEAPAPATPKETLEAPTPATPKEEVAPEAPAPADAAKEEASSTSTSSKNSSRRMGALGPIGSAFFSAPAKAVSNLAGRVRSGKHTAAKPVLVENQFEPIEAKPAESNVARPTRP